MINSMSKKRVRRISLNSSLRHWCGGFVLFAYVSLNAWGVSPTLDDTTAGIEEIQLRPFEAIYATSALGMTLDLTRSLSVTDGTYTLSGRGKNMLINMNESADFQIKEGRVKGLRFDSRVKTLKTNKRRVLFNESEGIIDSMKRGDWTQHPWEPDVLDRFSQQQQLRLTLLQTEEPPDLLTFRVVDGPKVSEKRWERLADEIIDTPIGSLATVKYRAVHTNPKKRASEIWLAPRLDYLMVKTTHVERSSTVKVAIKSLTWLDAVSD